MTPEVSKTRLPNGVRILTRKMPYVRSVSMGVWVGVGARDEALSESGLSHFIEHMIFKGTARRTAYQIAKAFDVIGGQTNAFTAMETTCYHARVMDAHLDTMVDILSDIFLNSVFDEKEVEKERPVIFQEIGMVEDNPEEYAHMLSERAYWGDHPLGRSILGTRENVITFNADMIRDFFHRFYQPDHIVISAAGNVEHDRLVDLIAPAFASVRTGDGLPKRVTPAGRSGVHAHPRDIEQAHICLETRGMSAVDPRRFAFSLINTLLGGNMSSRLFQEIREQRGLAYAVYSFASSYADAGAFGVYAAVHPQRIEETVELALVELRRMKSETVDPQELRDAKEFTKGCLLLSSESVDNQMARLAQNEIHFGEYFTVNQVIDNIEAVTPDEIQATARSLFQTEQLTLTLLGPAPDPAFPKDRLAL